MARIIIDGVQYEVRDGITALQAAIDVGYDIPHYCYHPGLSAPASCRLCLMEQNSMNPATKQMGWPPKLVPSCTTPVRDNPDGTPMEVRFNTDRVIGNQKHTMEYFLINHPLDCPVCDKAGECYLQDYSLRFGNAVSRMVEEKNKNPKKDIGSKTYIYSDRCVMCSRCVRFCREVAGTGELCITNRGSRAEIDVFPGFPLENALQGNVVDICPVGALLDKDFLFKQRVWLLTPTPSITVADSSGANIRIDHNDGKVYRFKPRYNPQANGWWISDEQRFDYKHIHDGRRLGGHRMLTADGPTALAPQKLGEVLIGRLQSAVRKQGEGSVAVLLSPFMSNEEAWMAAKLARQVDPQATLGLGFVPVVGEDQLFPIGTTDPAKAKFIIRAEKCPNRRGVEAVLNAMGGRRADYGELLGRVGQFKCVWIVGGHNQPEAAWRSELARAFATPAGDRPDSVIVQDLFASPLADVATLLIASASHAEREGSFTNFAGLTQPFERAIEPLGDFQPDGEWLWAATGHIGLFDPQTVRDEMSAAGLTLELAIAPEVADHQH